MFITTQMKFVLQNGKKVKNIEAGPRFSRENITYFLKKGGSFLPLSWVKKMLEKAIVDQLKSVLAN